MQLNLWILVAVFALAVIAAVLSSRSLAHVRDPDDRMRVALLGLFASRRYFDDAGRRLLRGARLCAAVALVLMGVWAFA